VFLFYMGFQLVITVKRLLTAIHGAWIPELLWIMFVHVTTEITSSFWERFAAYASFLFDAFGC
jgi:hypothetical protein